MTSDAKREPAFPKEFSEGQRLMEYRSDAFERNNLDAFLSLLGHRGNGAGWRATVEFWPDHQIDEGMKDGRSYLKLKPINGITIAILSDLTFAEINKNEEATQISKERAIELYGSERKLIHAIGDRFRQAVIFAKYLFPDEIPPEEVKIPEHLTPVGGK